MTTPKHTQTPFNGPLVVQELGSRPGYPAWTQFAIRDQKTNVHIATVGHVDRYFEGKAESHAEFIVRAVNAHEQLVGALESALRECDENRWPAGASIGGEYREFGVVTAMRAALRAARGEK